MCQAIQTLIGRNANQKINHLYYNGAEIIPSPQEMRITNAYNQNGDELQYDDFYDDYIYSWTK